MDADCENHHDAVESPNEVGIITTVAGGARLTLGIQWGQVPFRVVVADRDPGAELDRYEDAVEIAFEALSGRLTLEEWGGNGSHPLPPLPAGGGFYRLRYHVLGMDEEAEEDHYLLQIWPEPYRDAVVVKSTTHSFRYWLAS
ncbi:hypothetical protein [Herbidospora daliensis]|uniref:hypothetical protein n=1 Tax=Herbidospora daliensis TaxID=295585 RepID=UPI0007814BEB|nr:hypothetical protein [Herbidospora daliensis]